MRTAVRTPDDVSRAAVESTVPSTTATACRDICATLSRSSVVARETAGQARPTTATSSSDAVSTILIFTSALRIASPLGRVPRPWYRSRAYVTVNVALPTTLALLPARSSPVTTMR